MKAILLAGGKGERLSHLLNGENKVLMPLGDKRVIELLIDQLLNLGFNKAYLTLGYKGDKVESFIKGKSKYDGKVEFYHESKPLGAMGSIKIFEKEIDDDFLVINGDLATDINFKELYDFHKTSEKIATMALVKEKIKLERGVIKTDESNNVVDYLEKPTFEHNISTGIFAFKHDVFKYVNCGEWLDSSDVIKRLLAAGKKVGTNMFEKTWIHIRREEDYKKALEFYEKNKEKFSS